MATDVDHNSKLTYTAGSEHGTYGDFTLNADSGTWTYTLDNQHHQDLAAGETHTESMLVTVTDDKGATVTETVQITVTGTNDKPVITSNAQAATVKEDDVLFVDGQVTATDADHNAVLTYTPDNLQGTYGTFVLNPSSGKWHYTLDNNGHQALADGESHVETMLVTVTDDQGATTTQQVSVTVEGTNDKPVLNADTHTGSVNEDGTLFARGQVLATDVDHNSKLTYTAGSEHGTYGDFTLNADSGTWTYKLDNKHHQDLAAGETQTESMLVTVTDDKGAKVTETVEITITGTNDKPVITSQTQAEAVKEDGVAFVEGQVTATDVDHNALLTYTPDNLQGTYGTFVLNPSSGKWNYTLDNDANQALAEGESHVETMLVTVTDDQGATTTQQVRVTVEGTNDVPKLQADTHAGSVNEDGTLLVRGQVLASDVDHNSKLTYTAGSQHGIYGDFTLNADSGTWTYKLDNKHHQDLAAGETQTESMLVTVTDDKGAKVTETVEITITGTNDKPVITSQTQAEAVKEDGVAFVEGQVTATDVDHNAVLTYTPDNLQGTYGTFVLNPSSGEWNYQLDNKAHQALAEGESHVETMLVTVTDDHGATTTQQVRVTVEGTNDVPVLHADTHTGSVEEDGTLSTNGQVIATDVDNHAKLTFSANELHGTYGEFTLDADSGEWTYKLANDQHQDLSEGETHKELMSVTVTDDKGAKVVETVEVVVTGTNDLPVLTFTDQASDHTQGTLSFIDVDTLDTHSYSVSGGASSGDTQTIVGQFGDLLLDTKTGEYTYTQHQSVAGMSIDANGVYHAKEFFEVSVADNHGGTSTKYLTFEPSVAVNAPIKDGQPPVLTPELTQAPELLDQQPVIAPIVPPTNQLNPLTIDPSSDTGASQTDGITSVVTPSVTGHTDIPFSVVTLTDENGNVVALTTSNEHGDFTVALAQLSGSVSGDVHQISGTAVAPSATVSVSTPTPLQLTIDTDINQPTVDITDGKTQTALHPNHIISGTELSHVDISGVIDHQGVETDLTGLTVTDTQGNVAPLDPSQATVDPATGVFTLNNVDLSKFGLVDGTLTVHAIATDLAGNTKEGTFTATLDTQPGTIAIDGTLGGDNVINAVETQSPLTVSGTTTGIEEGQVVAIKFNGQSYSAIVGKDGTWSTDIPVSDLGKLTDGTTPIITASVDDKAGNVATPATHDMQVDTHIDTTTVALNDGGVGANFDGVINAAEQTHAVITGTIDPTAKLTLLTISDGTDTIPVPLASVLVSQDGHFIATGVDVSSLSDGTLTVTATAVDPAGNESSNTGSALMDTAPPNAPQLTPIPVGHDKTPPLSGTGEPGSTVTFFDGHGNTIGSTVVGKTGSFTYTPSTGLPDGGTISATLTDIHGNTSASTTIQTNIDTHIAPTTADITDGTVGSTQHPNHQISADELHSVLITGSIDRTDGTEKLTTLTVTDSAGTQVNLDIKLATFDSSTGKFSIKGLDLSGSHFVSGALTVEATSQDSAGNISIGHGTATLDIAPGELFFDNVLSGDNIVNAKESQSPLTISGTTTDIEAGQIVDVTIAGTTYHATVDASGHWAAVMPQTDVAKLPDGDVIMQATVQDLAGNSTQVISHQLSVDTHVKPPESITFESTGQDNLYNIKELGLDHTVTATIELPDDVKSGDILTINGVAQTLTDQDIAHNYVNTEVSPNTKVTASITDQAGNTSQDISNTAAGEDLTPPLTPVLSPIPNADHNNDNTPPITGITEPGAVVEILIDNISVGTVTANQAGSFSYTPPILPDGPHSFTAKATDHAGNPSTLSTAVHTTIDTTPPAQLDLSLVKDTGISHTDLITQTGSLHIGNQEAGSHVLYSIDHGTTWSNSFTPVEGGNTVTVKQVDQAGNESPTTSLTFTLDTKVAAPQVKLKLDSGSSAIDHITNNAELEVSDVESGAHVEYSIDGGQHWLDSIGHQIDGDYTVLVRQTDVAGNVSGSTTISYTLDTQTHVDVAIADISTGAVHGNHFLNDYEIVHNENEITGHIELSGELTKLVISDGNHHQVTVDLSKVNLHNDGSFDISHTDLSSLDDGTLTVTATSKDTAGNTDTQSSTIFKDTINEATDITGSVKEESKTTISGHVNMEPDAHGSSSYASGSSSLSGDIDGTYGTLHLNKDGTYTYDLHNANPKVQALGKGATLQDIVTYKTTDPAGNEKESHLTVTITGTNDQAVIAGVDSGDVVEDKVSTTDHSLLKTDGQLTIDDIDTNTLTAGGEEQFVSKVTPAANAHNLGSLSIDKDGHWHYQVRNDNQHVQALQEQDTHVDQFIVHSIDGTAHTISVTITGTKDAPTIEVKAGADHGAVVEQGSTSSGHAIAGQQTATGHLVAHDVDTADTQAWTIVGSSDGSYGHISVDANGEWTYTLDNARAATQGLTQDQHVTESFTVRVTDSTGLTADQKVVINVTGSNDQAQIGGTDARSVKEDSNAGGSKHQLHTDGQLTISDVDSGEAHFQASTMVAGQDGHLGSLSIDETGHWDYVVDNSLLAVQQLKESDHIDDVFTVLGADGTEHIITVTINGTNDLPEIAKGTGDSGTVTEAGSHADSHHNKAVDDGQSSTSGTLSATDRDAGDPAHWQVAHPDGTYGHLSLNAQTGHWVYTLDNAKADGLHAKETVTETFAITDTDSSNSPVSTEIVITITGSNDVPVITGSRAGAVTEAGGTLNSLAGVVTIDGTLTATDPDNNDGTLAWSVQGATSGTTVKEGTYGSISIDQHGHWVYTIDDSKDATQALTGKQSPIEHFTFLVTDSSGQSIKQDVDITVHGSNDNPVLSAYTPTTFAEDSSPNHIQTVTLPKVIDVDDSTFTYSIDSHLDHGNHNHQWITIDRHTGVISVHTDAKDLQHLSVGATHTEDVVVTVTDAQGGTTQQTLHLTIAGTNDAPKITSAKITSNYDEHGTKSTSGVGANALARVDVIEDHTVSGIVQFSDVDDKLDPNHPTGDIHQFYLVDDKGHQINEPGFILDKNTGAFLFNTNIAKYQHLQIGETERVDFNVEVVDNHGLTSTKTLHFIVHGRNDAPQVVLLHPLQVLEDATLKFSVDDLVGDKNQYIVDPEGDAMAISDVKVVNGSDGQVHGSIVDLGMGNYQFKPDANYHGEVHLQYKVDDGRGNTMVKNGIIIVTPQNDSPTESATQLAHVAEDSGAITFTSQDLLKHIHDIDNVGSSNAGIELVAGSVALQHGEGTLVHNSDGTWTFTPDADWNSHKGGGDAEFSFKYIETGSAFGQASGVPVEYSGSAAIKIDPVQDPATIHVPLPASVITAGGADITGKLTVTDPDLNEDHFKAESSIQGAHGFAKINTQGEWQYQLATQDPAVQALGEGETITDTIKVHSMDGTEASLVIEIHGTNDKPKIALARQITATEANANDDFTTDPKLVTGHFAATDPDAHDTVTFTLIGHSNPAGAHFHGNTVPGLTLNSDGSYRFDRTDPAYDYLQEGETLSFDITIQASDNHGGIDTRVVPVVIIGTNDAPTISQPIASLGTLDSTTNFLKFEESTLLGSATDVDGDLLSIFKVGTSQNADVQVLDSTLGRIDEDGAGGYIYHPTANARGKDVTISYKVTDGREVVIGTTVIHVDPLPPSTGQSGTGSSTTTGNTQTNGNVPPPVVTDTDIISGDLTGDVGEDGGASYKDASGHVHQIDADGHVTAKSPTEGHSHGVFGANHTPGKYGYLSVTPEGKWTYHLYSHTGLTDPVNQLSEGETLKDSISIESAHSGHQDITITIHGTNDAPIIMGVENVQVFKQGGNGHALTQPKAIIEVDKMHLEGDLKAQDPDSQDHVIYAVDPSKKVQGFTIDQHGHYRYTPSHGDPVLQGLKPGDTRDVTAQVLVSDGHGGHVTVPIVMTVHGQNTAPTADKDVDLGHSDEDLTVQIDGTSIGSGQLVAHAGTVDLVALAHAKDIDNDDLHVVNIKVDGGHGTFTDKGNGVYEFVPEDNYHGSVGFTYEITDGLESVQVHATLKVDSINDKPIAHDFTLKTTDEDRAIHFTTRDIIGQGSARNHGHVDDPDFATDSNERIELTDVSLVDKSQGTLVADGKGGYTFTPAKDVNGDIRLQYKVHDHLGSHRGVQGGQQSDTGTATIHVNPINDKPVITDSIHGSSTEDKAQTYVAEGKLDITDADSGEGSFVANSHMTPHSGGNYGYLELDKQGHWKYHLMKNFDSHIQGLAAGERLEEHFILHTDDGAGTTHELVVEIIGTNDGATISGTHASTMQTEVTQSVTEQLGSSVSATAVQNEITTTGTLTVHDVDHGEAFFKAQTLQPTNSGHHYGTLTIQQSGEWTYVVDNNNRDVQALHEGEQIQEHFTVTSLDGTATQDITVTLVGKNNAPVIAHVASQPATEAGATLTGQLHSSDIDNDHTTVTYSLQPGTSAPDGFALQANGHYSFDPTNKAYNALSAGETKTVVAHVVATDSHNGVSEAKDIEFVITGTNDTATFSGQSAVHVQDSPSLHDNAASAHRQLHVADVDHGESHFQAENSILPDSSHPSHTGLPTSAYGHLSITDNGQWQYHVDHADRVKAIPKGQHVTETFTVHSADGTPHTVTVTLDGKNEAATFKGDFSGEVTDGQSASVTGTVHVADVDYGQAGLTKAQNHLAPSNTDIQHHTGLSTHAYGHLTVDTRGHWAYYIDDTAAFNSIADGQKVIETFSIAAKDGTHHNIVITLIGRNDAPTVSGAVAMQQYGTEDKTMTLDQSQLLSHAVDVDNADHLTVVNVQALHGTIKVDQQGKIHYTPNANYHGPETFTYDVQDSQGATVHTQASMQVNSVNDAPTVAHSVTLTGINEDTHSSIDASALLAGASDVDRDRLSILGNSVTAEHGQIRYDSHSHTYLYYPDHNFNGQDTLHYKVSDGHGGQVAQTATIDVASVNDAPTVTAPVSLPDHAEDSTVTITSAQLLTHAQDDDGDSLSISDLQVNHGKLVHHRNGTWSYTPDQDYNGKVTLNYQVRDGHGEHVQQQALMTVTPENDAAHIDAPAVMYVDNGHNSFVADKLSITDVDGSSEERFKPETGLKGQYGELEISADGQFKYVLNSHLPIIQQMMDGDTKTDTVTVHSVDGTAYDVQIHIGGHTNHAPTVSQHTPIVLQTNEHHQFSSTDFLFSDTDGDSLDHITITQLPTHGELTLNGHHVQANQTVTASDIDKLLFTADNHYSGSVTFDFTANDGKSDSVAASMTISVSHPHTGHTANLGGFNPAPPADSSDEAMSHEAMSHEAMSDEPVETVSLESLASHSDSGHIDGAQAYLNQLGVSDDSLSEPSFATHQPVGDLDLVLAQSSDVVLDAQGHVVETINTEPDNLNDDDHKHHDELHHQDLHHQWDDHHG
ncbi:VCBS domain-containing protein [Vibrio sp. B1Z05]|uniref:VCBS domain-containing protein n=1 Tax=Vibrio sp. B1Z05 TaxID=2654980 RepID=UPI00128C66A6|nr:VCBS domain-containing protein [Vibrio sp. B1Z05]MPW35915.1 tandem-95 repeat protein [Vibrio sp. B1Z05]